MRTVSQRFRCELCGRFSSCGVVESDADAKRTEVCAACVYTALKLLPCRPRDARPPVLFLDIDGVLNVLGGSASGPVEQLHRVVDSTGCDIVLSSAWRLFREPEAAIRKRFGYTGPSFVGATPDLKGQPRGHEIACWLASQPLAPRCWAVVDDEDDDMGSVRHRFVKTNPRIGLDEVAADRLIELLVNENASLVPGDES